MWLNPAYFLTFAPEGKKKVAYAPSLGIRTMPAGGKVRKIRKWTEGFDAVSVREQEGADLLEKMTGIRADVMPDPVCLLSREEWAEIAAPAPAGGDYLLCYFIGTNESYREKVRRISEETGRFRRHLLLHGQLPRPGVRDTGGRADGSRSADTGRMIRKARTAGWITSCGRSRKKVRRNSGPRAGNGWPKTCNRKRKAA